MKKIILIAATIGFILNSCASYKLDKTIWYSPSVVEKEKIKGVLTTSLYFLSGNTVDIYSSVMVDTTLIVKPFKYASGTYSVSGNPKKEAKISITAVTLEKNTIEYNGAFHKAEAMILVSQDSISKVYGKLPKTKLP